MNFQRVIYTCALGVIWVLVSLKIFLRRFGVGQRFIKISPSISEVVKRNLSRCRIYTCHPRPPTPKLVEGLIPSSHGSSLHLNNHMVTLHKKWNFSFRISLVNVTLRIWPHLLKRILMENFIFCALLYKQKVEVEHESGWNNLSKIWIESELNPYHWVIL